MKIKLIDYGYTQAPSRKHYNDAGVDVYIQKDVRLSPHAVTKIPLGFGIEVPDGYAGYVFPRSSLAAQGLVCELPPIDSGYRGEINAIVSNVTDDVAELQAGERVGQLVIMPVIIADYVTNTGEERKTGAFGSTGR